MVFARCYFIPRAYWQRTLNYQTLETNAKMAAARSTRKRSRKDGADEPQWFALACGDAPGVYTTRADLHKAQGTHHTPLWKVCTTEDAAGRFVAMFADADAVVYTDGSCPRNGQAGAAAGVGVYWGPDHARNVSRPVRGQYTSNNVAELEAIEEALQQIAEDADLKTQVVVVVSDSMYSIQAVTTWYPGFVRRAWKTTGGTEVKNPELIRSIRTMLDTLPQVRLVHVHGHVGHAGNEAADALAGAGGEMATVAVSPC
jgi:ribonuclease HI